MNQEIPLMPLDAVLFPEGQLNLRLFELRYLEMAKHCLREDSPFGICLIAHGQEVGVPAEPHSVGTLATIAGWDMAELGILELRVVGQWRFRVLEHHADANGLVCAHVAAIDNPPVHPIPGTYARLVPLLRAVVEDMGERAPPKPHRFFDAYWLGCRWSEVLPIPPLARQKLLELEDPLVRLEVVQRFLTDKGVLR